MSMMSLVKLKITPCFCLPLKGGTIFIAIITCLLSFAVWFASCINLMTHSSHHYKNEICQDDYELWEFIKIVFFVFSLSSLILSVFLLYGVIKDKPTKMVPWLCVQFGLLFLFAGFNFAWLFTGHYFASPVITKMLHIFGLVILTMYIYMFMVLYSYYNVLIDKPVPTKKNSGRVYGNLHDIPFASSAPTEIV